MCFCGCASSTQTHTRTLRLPPDNERPRISEHDKFVISFWLLSDSMRLGVSYDALNPSRPETAKREGTKSHPERQRRWISSIENGICLMFRLRNSLIDEAYLRLPKLSTIILALARQILEFIISDDKSKGLHWSLALLKAFRRSLSRFRTLHSADTFPTSLTSKPMRDSILGS